MRLVRELSSAPSSVLDTADAMIELCRQDEKRLIDFAMQIWPALRFGRDGALLHFYVMGESSKQNFCVELKPERQAA